MRKCKSFTHTQDFHIVYMTIDSSAHNIQFYHVMTISSAYLLTTHKHVVSK
jgi:hypothetical protein